MPDPATPTRSSPFLFSTLHPQWRAVMPAEGPTIPIRAGNITLFQYAESAAIAGEKKPTAQRSRRLITRRVIGTEPGKDEVVQPAKVRSGRRSRRLGSGCIHPNADPNVYVGRRLCAGVKAFAGGGKNGFGVGQNVEGGTRRDVALTEGRLPPDARED